MTRTRLEADIPSSEKDGKPWRITVLRAIRPDGSPVWPARIPMEFYQMLWDSGGSALFSAVQMQDPSGISGNIFNPEDFRSFCWPDYVDPDTGWDAQELLARGRVQAIAPDRREMFSIQAHDLAVKKVETADYYARWNAYGSRDHRIFVDWVYQARLNFRERIADITKGADKYHPIAIGIESNAFQSDTFEEVRRLSFHPYVEVPSTLDKVMRARPLAARYESGDVYHRYNAKWRPIYEAQLGAFPGGAHDDMVDAASLGYWLLQHKAGTTSDDIDVLNRAMRRESLIPGAF
jgi:predicted phage terminase large subunit-like protein